MVASLLDEGAGDLDSKTFHERLERRAIELSFSSARDNLRGSLRMLKDNKDEAFDLLRMALTSARFDATDVERIRNQVLSGLRRETTNPSSLAGRKFLELAYGDHPYARSANGTLESVPKIEIADLKDYVARVVARDRLRIAVVGDVDPDTLGKLLDKAFGGLQAKANLTPVADVVAAKPPQRAFVPLDVPQTVITFGGPGIRRHDPDFMAGYVVNHILGGGGLSSRLYREVREKRGLAYSIYESLTVDGAFRAVHRQHRHPRRPRRRDRRCHRDGNPPHRRGRPDPEGAGRRKVLPEGLADAGARYLVEAGAGAAAISARQAADRLHRKAQRAWSKP